LYYERRRKTLFGTSKLIRKINRKKIRQQFRQLARWIDDDHDDTILYSCSLQAAPAGPKRGISVGVLSEGKGFAATSSTLASIKGKGFSKKCILSIKKETAFRHQEATCGTICGVNGGAKPLRVRHFLVRCSSDS
jgi:hypothetical protein